jgi:plastocyanin
MRTRVRTLALGLALAATPLVMAACAGGGAAGSAAAPVGTSQAAANAQTLDVKTQAMKFEPATLTVKAGQPVLVNLTNGDALVHDFSVKDAEQPIKFDIPAGGKSTGTFTIKKAGTYEYFCAVPGHEQAGMKGTLTVQ